MQGLGTHIIKPFQRICRYPLLLKELYKDTPSDWPDHESLGEAIRALDITVKAANEAKRVTDDLLQVMEIQNKLLNATGEAKQLHRHVFVMEESFRRISSKGKATKCHFFLFKVTTAFSAR